MLGLDLLELWQQRQWRRLLSLLEQMPLHCRWRTAQLNDPEYAEAVADVLGEDDDDEDAAGPSWSDWNPLVDQMATVADLLRALLSQNAGSKTPPRWGQRPQTALHKARETARQRAARADHNFLIGALLGDRADN